VKLLDTPISSPFDQKKYRAIQLQNGLKVLLIQDIFKENKKIAEPFHLADSEQRLDGVQEEGEEEANGPLLDIEESPLKKKDLMAEKKRRSVLDIHGSRTRFGKTKRQNRWKNKCKRNGEEASSNNNSGNNNSRKDNDGYNNSGKDNSGNTIRTGKSKMDGVGRNGVNNNSDISDKDVGRRSGGNGSGGPSRRRKSRDDDVDDDDDDDGGSDFAAAALTVGVGSACDPEDLQGLAHLLEHSIFLGCKGYPGEAEFDQFLNDHGGESNASTDFERITFQFDVSLSALKRSLQRFVKFFVSPLLLAERVKREIGAVDSEFCERKQNDALRLIQVLKTTINKHHPLAGLGDGNRKSLDERPSLYGIDIAAALKDYFQKYFCASNMGLVIQAAKSLDILEKWVNAIFREIPAHGTAEIPNFSTEFYRLPFNPTLFSQAFKVVPIAAVNQLDVAWVLPPMKQKWREKAVDFIYFLLSNDGPGSLLQYLRRRLWCMQIMYGFEDSEFEENSCCTLLTLSFSLTYEGQRHVLGIMSALFYFINMLRNSMAFELGRVYEERKQMLDIFFTWQEEEEADEYVARLSYNMLIYPSKNVLSGDTLWRNFDAELVHGILERLSPGSANFTVSSKRFSKECAEREKWYGVAFCRWEDDLLTEWRRRAESIWSSKSTIKDFSLPNPNRYIPSNFDLLEESEMEKMKEEPSLRKKEPYGKLWWKVDERRLCGAAMLRLLPVDPRPRSLIDEYLFAQSARRNPLHESER